MENQANKLHKQHNHSHFFIDGGFLGASYRTIRGLRFYLICEVEANDQERVDDETANELYQKHGIEKKL